MLWGSSGIGLGGQQAAARLMMDCEEHLSISLLASGSSTHGPHCVDGRTVASRHDDKSGCEPMKLPATTMMARATGAGRDLGSLSLVDSLLSSLEITARKV